MRSEMRALRQSSGTEMRNKNQETRNKKRNRKRCTELLNGYNSKNLLEVLEKVTEAR